MLAYIAYMDPMGYNWSKKMWKGKNVRPLSKQPEDVPHAPDLIWSSDFTVALRLAAIADVLAPDCFSCWASRDVLNSIGNVELKSPVAWRIRCESLANPRNLMYLMCISWSIEHILGGMCHMMSHTSCHFQRSNPWIRTFQSYGRSGALLAAWLSKLQDMETKVRSRHPMFNLQSLHPRFLSKINDLIKQHV